MTVVVDHPRGHWRVLELADGTWVAVVQPSLLPFLGAQVVLWSGRRVLVVASERELG